MRFSTPAHHRSSIPYSVRRSAHLWSLELRLRLRKFSEHSAYDVEVFFPGGVGDENVVKPTDHGFFGRGECCL